MDSFEINKIIGAVLLVALLVIGLGKISNMVFKVNKPEKAGYKVSRVKQLVTNKRKSRGERTSRY